AVPRQYRAETVAVAVERRIHLAEERPFLVCVSGDAAEVEEGETAVVAEEVISRMWIGVGASAGVIHPKGNGVELRAEGVAIRLRGIRGQPGIEMTPLDVLHGEDSGSAELPENARNDDPVAGHEQRARMFDG